MNFIRKFFEYAIFSCSILLAFLLVFDQYLSVPGFVLWIGKWHPVILHFPIVLIFITIIQYWRKDVSFDWFLSTTTFLTFITAISGFLLRLEGGSKGNLILAHQWMGVSVSYIMALWFWLNQGKHKRNVSPVIFQGVLIILIVITGHFGGMVTHGQDFLAFGEKKVQSLAQLPDNPQIYNYIIQPILDEKCVSCHNQNKSKGELVLSDFNSIMKGGESGEIIDDQHFENSRLLERISLNPEDEDHMPPKDEKQLTENELILLSHWIKTGANERMLFNDLDVNGQSYALVQKLIDQSKNNRWDDLPDVSDDELIKLSSNYVRVIRLFSQSNALQVIIYPHESYTSSTIKDLRPVARNIVELNLSGLPLNEEALEFVGSCINLEKLNMSNTPIGDENILKLVNLEKLTELKIYNTSLTDNALNSIRELSGLSSLYVYNTGLSEEGISKYRIERNDVLVIKTAEEAKDFKSVLPVPAISPRTYFFSEPFRIKLDHPLVGINLLYTVDGSTPAETSANALDSLEIDKSMLLKFYAAKAGWESSPVDSMRFFKTIRKPDRYTLTHSPNSNFAGRGEKLLFDHEKGIEIFGDSAWMAFREEDFILNCEWNEEVSINSVVLSSVVHTDPYLFPPESIIIRGGMEKSNMKILGRLLPSKLDKRTERYFDFYECQFDPAAIRFIEITVQSLQRIPIWHSGKGEKGWFFIDEVVFE